MKFLTVANYFDMIENERSRTVITQLLAELIGKLSVQDTYVVCTMALGTLRPSYLGMQFNIAEKQLRQRWHTCQITGKRSTRITQTSR